MPAISLTDYVNQTDNRLRKGIVQKITNESVFLRRLRFIPIPTFEYRYPRQETLGGIAFRNLNQDYTPDTGVVNPLVESVAIFGGEVQTDRQLAGGGNSNNVRASAIGAKLRKAGLFYDKYVIDGDPGVNGMQFYGLNARLTGAQVISAGTNGAALTLDMVDALLDAVPGANERKVLVMNKADRRGLKKLIVNAAGGAAVGDFGPTLQTYDGAPIEVIDEDGDEAAILGKDETQGSSSVTSSMYCIRPGTDTEGEFVQGLVKTGGAGDLIDHVDQGVRGTSFIDLIEAALGLAVFHPRAAARLKGIL